MKILIQKLFFRALTALLLTCALAQAGANPSALTFENLPKDTTFENLFTDFGNAYDTIRNPDFQADCSEEVQKAKNLYDYLKKQKKPNYDEQVLKLLVMRCLYNYDAVTQKAVEGEFAKIQKKFPKNAAHHWIYGNYLVSAGKVPEGKAELETYMEMNEMRINILFAEDYAYSQLMCGMPLNALYTITNGGRVPKEHIPNQKLLSYIQNAVKESSSRKEYTEEEVWRLSEKEGDYIFAYSTMLGISFPLKENWTVRLQPFTKETPAICHAQINDFSINESPVGINLMLLASPESASSDMEQRFAKMFPVTKKEEKVIRKIPFTVYTFEDKNMYADARKGSRGFLYAAKVTPDEFSGLRCEYGHDLSRVKNDGSGIKYLQLSPAQKRLEEPVTILIMMDSCTALAKETDSLLEELLSKAVFE